MTASLDDIKRPIFFQTRCKACLSACPDLSCSARTLVDCSVHQLSGMAITSLSNRMELGQHEATLPALPLNLERMATHPLHPNLFDSDARRLFWMAHPVLQPRSRRQQPNTTASPVAVADAAGLASLDSRVTLGRGLRQKAQRRMARRIVVGHRLTHGRKLKKYVKSRKSACQSHRKEL